MYEQYLDLNELSKRMSLSPRTLRAWVKHPTDSIPAYRIGGKLLVRWRELEAWIETHRVTTADAEAIAAEVIATAENSGDEEN